MASNPNRMSSASDRTKRWSLPALQPLADTRRTSTANPPPQNMLPLPPKGTRSNRGSISGTSYGKSDFGVPTSTPPAQPAAGSVAERRLSKRTSRLSKLSDVSEADSEKKQSRVLSMAVTILEDDQGQPVPRRQSTARRQSVADDLGVESERRRSRRMSNMSFTSNVNRLSLMSRANNDWEQREEHDVTDAPKQWDDDLKNPVNWETQKKVVNTGICCAFALVHALTLTMYASATPYHPAEFGVSTLLSLVPYATFAAGLAFGAAFATPFEIAYGRKPVFLYSTPLFGLLLIGAGVSKNIAGLAACRFFAALFASPTLFLSYAVISDMWILIHETLAIASFVASLILGIFVGPIVGGVISQQAGWRWTQWVPLICVVLLLFAAIGMTETQEAAIKRKIKTPEQIEKEIAERRAHRVTRKEKRLHFRGNLMIGKMFGMMAARPALAMVTLYLAYVLAIMFIIPVFAPANFALVYNFTVLESGLTAASGAAGVALALAILFILDHYVHQPRVARWEEENDPFDNRGDAELARDAPARSSWRKGLAVSTRNIGNRSSVATDISTLRSESDASAATRRAKRSSRRLSGDSSHRRSRHLAFSERNINIAIAVTRFLNSQPANADRKIIVERVMVLLKNTDSFTTITTSLYDLGLAFEEALLAKVIVEALGKDKSGSEIELYRSRSLHRFAAQAALMGDKESASRSASSSDEKAAALAAVTTTAEAPISPTDSSAPVSPLDPSSPGAALLPSTHLVEEGGGALSPPPEWRMLPALLGALLFPAGLFMLAWTLHPLLPWIVPCIGLAIASCGATLATFGVTAYAMELFPFTTTAESVGAAFAARAAATVATFALAAGLSVAVVPIFDALGPDVGLSVLAGVGAALGFAVVVVAFGSKAGRLGKKSAPTAAAAAADSEVSSGESSEKA